MSNSPKNDDINNNLYKDNESLKVQKENFQSNNMTYYNNSRISSPDLLKNNSSLSLLNRNMLSINNSHFDHLKRVKSQSTLYQLDSKGNNYLKPISNYSYINNEMKEKQKRNSINSLEWLSIIKHKLFSIDINTRVKKGENISRNQFYEQKNKIIIAPNKLLKTPNEDNKGNKENKDNKVITSYQHINTNKTNNNGFDHKFNSSASMDNIFNSKRFKIDSEGLNKKMMNIKEFLNNKKESNDYWKNIKLQKNKILDTSFDSHKSQRLKDNFLYFDKNHQFQVRPKNWWKIDP